MAQRQTALGRFDYIISHGVYSWVPPAVQDRMLEICSRQLAPNGIAYVSYNTYPGWHVRGIVRDMMFYRGSQFADRDDRLAQAKTLVRFVARASRGSETPYRRLLQSELEHIGRMEDHYLHHEHLEQDNRPLYFHEFAKRLAENGLQYLGDAEFSTMVSSNFSPDVAATLRQLGAHDIVQMEQYMDYLRCRYFRRSLICHGGVSLKRTIAPTVVAGMLLASDADPASADAPLEPEASVSFRTPAGASIACRSPLTKTALRILRREWPMPVVFEDLPARAGAESADAGHPADDATADSFLAREMLTGIGANVIDWRLTPVPFTTSVGARPASSPLARLQAGKGYMVLNLRGELVTLDEIHRQTLRRLDGSRDLSQLTGVMLEALRRGEVALRRDADEPVVGSEADMRALLGPALRGVLENLARRALLVAVR